MQLAGHRARIPHHAAYNLTSAAKRNHHVESVQAVDSILLLHNSETEAAEPFKNCLLRPTGWENRFHKKLVQN